MRSVKDLTTHLGDGDTITLNFLNVVRDTQVDLLERAGLYHKWDMCRFREFVQRLSTVGHRFQILPGCIAVRTCSERDLADGHVCSNCLKWLTLTETQIKYTGRIKCSELPGFNLELPWGIFSDFEDRCRFVQSQLHLGATPYPKPLPIECPKCAAVKIEFDGTAGKLNEPRQSRGFIG